MRPCLFDGPISGERFRGYVGQFLVPTLKRRRDPRLSRLAQGKGRAEGDDLALLVVSVIGNIEAAIGNAPFPTGIA
jgi:hypothetical protein